MGAFANLGAAVRNLAGGEIVEVTRAIHDGRQAALARLDAEAQAVGASGVTGVSSALTTFEGHTEFLSIGSAVHRPDGAFFTSSFDGKELYSLLDAGYEARRFVFGNIAYGIGIGGGIMARLKRLARGEIRELSGIVNATRHKALARMMEETRAAGGNAALGVRITLRPFANTHEMLMTGTAAWHPDFTDGAPVSSDLPCDEMWSLAKVGYVPLKIVMGCAVYSVGVAGNVLSAVRSMARGELGNLTSLVYDAREHALSLMEAEAREAGADIVMGTDLHINDMSNGVIEFLAIGTAMKKRTMVVASDILPAQAILHNRETDINQAVRGA